MVHPVRGVLADCLNCFGGLSLRMVVAVALPAGRDCSARSFRTLAGLAFSSSARVARTPPDLNPQKI